MKSKSAFWVGVVASLPVLLSAAQPPGEPVLLRTALLVKDAKVAARFYELLGFRTETEMDNPRKPRAISFRSMQLRPALAS